MQQVAATTTIVNDIGLFDAQQIPAFRAFLEKQGLQVRDGGAGQFFHARLPDLARWLPIERGKAGAPVTPALLRSFVDQFVYTLVESAPARAARQTAERAVARAALSLPRECAPVEHAESDPGETVICTNALACRPPVSLQGSQVRKLPVEDAQYLSDLRDDFALHAPIPLGQFATDQDMRDNAIRRFQYADLMMAARTTQAGD